MNTKVDFNNSSKAFIKKSNSQLYKTLWLFRLMKFPIVVKIFSGITIIFLKIKLPIKTIIRKTIFEQFCGGENLSETQKIVTGLKQSNIGSILDYSVEGKNNSLDFEQTKTEVIEVIKIAQKNHSIPYTCLKLSGIISAGSLEKLSTNQRLTLQEKGEYEKGTERLEEICNQAYTRDVPIYFDAEESWIQEPIDRLAEDMMRKYNKKKAIILTTLQMYRIDRIDYLKFLLKIAKDENFFIGIKLVRGAYLEKENLRAEQLGYPSPIQISKNRTDSDFNKAITICLENINRVTLCAGTHNEASTIHLLNEMSRLGIPNDNENVYFSQLYGMSDHITYNLAAANYNVTKYLPYGPIESVIPYLIRRAQENTAIAGQMGRELQLITKERDRRAEQYLLKNI